MEEKVLVHQHLIVRAEVKNPLMEIEQTKTWLSDLVEKIGMCKVLGPFSAYTDKVVGNRGITGGVIIETSHIVVHIWDEPDPALVQLDVYTCSCLDVNIVFDHLKVMNPVKVEYKYLDREHGLHFVEI